MVSAGRNVKPKWIVICHWCLPHTGSSLCGFNWLANLGQIFNLSEIQSERGQGIHNFPTVSAWMHEVLVIHLQIFMVAIMVDGGGLLNDEIVRWLSVWIIHDEDADATGPVLPPVWAEISPSSPRTLFVFIINKCIYRIKESQKINILFWKKLHLTGRLKKQEGMCGLATVHQVRCFERTRKKS